MSIELIENEKKYIGNINVNDKEWSKEHIIYQWYIQSDIFSSIKIKLIFDLINRHCILVKIEKKRIEQGLNNKIIEYLDISDFAPKEFLGIPFVLKRRRIYNGIFLDCFIRSNGITKTLIEIEDNQEINTDGLVEVTNNMLYHNQNMCTFFLEDDLVKLEFLIQTLDFCF